MLRERNSSSSRQLNRWSPINAALPESGQLDIPLDFRHGFWWELPIAAEKEVVYAGQRLKDTQGCICQQVAVWKAQAPQIQPGLLQALYYSVCHLHTQTSAWHSWNLHQLLETKLLHSRDSQQRGMIAMPALPLWHQWVSVRWVWQGCWVPQPGPPQRHETASAGTAPPAVSAVPRAQKCCHLWSRPRSAWCPALWDAWRSPHPVSCAWPGLCKSAPEQWPAWHMQPHKLDQTSLICSQP